MTLKEIVAANAAAFRQAAGLTLEELAKRSGLSVQYHNRIERRKINLSLEVIDKLASGLGVPASKLLEMEAQNPVDAQKLRVLIELSELSRRMAAALKDLENDEPEALKR